MSYDTVLDDYVITSNINTITSLNVSNLNISDLTGIEDFVALTFLRCYNNPLGSLDVTQNTALTFLYCYSNNLTSLDVTQNTALTNFWCFANNLTSLDVSENTALVNLQCFNNQLTSLNLSANTVLDKLLCYNNNLISLNIKNGNNTNTTNANFNATNNSNLTCIDVDDAVWSTANWTNKDPQTSFSENCGTKIWEVGVWINGAPTLTDNAIIRDNYSTIIQGANIEANNLILDATYTLTVESGDYVQVENNCIINGNLIIQHEGSFLQNNNASTVTNNGSIQVLKEMTSFDIGTDFAILGSPMTGETRDGVYNQNNVTMNHLSSNFVPNAAVALADPTAENFADDNGNNWQFFTSSEAIIPGAGYLVGGVTGGGNFTSNYNQGTLNNGIINFNTIYNGSQNASPNVLSNPYASAIDADVFINNNNIIDALYFWEHLTAPSSSYPGYRAENWDMGDISLYNLSGGIAAANGGTAPTQYIPSGQGFAIKANAAGTVSFNNSMRVTSPNTGYRNSENTNRMYIKVSNETYGLKSSTLIAFTENATDGIEASYDSKRLAIPVSIYSIVEEQELAIQGRSAFNEDQIIPIGFRTQVEELQEYTISLGSIEGTEITNTTVYLQDNLLQTETNLSETNYSFTSENGNFSDRFIIYFREESLGINDVNNISVLLYPNPVANQVTISSTATISTVFVYDLSGRLIRTINANEQTTHTIDLSELSLAIYFVEVKTPKGSIIKRIIKE